MAKPDFLSSSGGGDDGSSSGGGGGDKFANIPQKQGSTSGGPDGGGVPDNFESIPQKQGGSSDFTNPNSKTSGGPKPYSSPAVLPKLPAKLKG